MSQTDKSEERGLTRNGKAALLICAGIMLLVIAHFTYQWSRGPAVEEWPFSVTDDAERVSLSVISELLSQDGEGRRAAIIEDRVYVERVGHPVDPEATEPSEATGLEAATAAVLYAELPFPNAVFVQDKVLSSTFDVEVFSKSGLGIMNSLTLAFQFTFLILIVYLFLRMTGRVGGDFGTESGFEVVELSELKTGIEAVAGLQNARMDITEVIELMKNGGSAAIAGGRLPRGMLLDGPPGTGKTLLARAMAKEAGVNFIRVDASSLSQMFVGLGAMKVRRLFRKARKLAPAIIFIDEIDAIGGARGSGRGGDQDRENTLNALLTELDGFEERSGIFVIAATNRPDMLDRALTRPGRIDRRITMHLPDLQARKEILAVHCDNKTLGQDVDLGKIASTAYQMSGADLANLANEAALVAGRAGRKVVEMSDFTEARDRLMLPRSGGSISMQEDERRITAYHEAGHAIAAHFLEYSDPIEKVTISPSGGALGFVLQTPGRDRVFESKARLEARLVVAVAGRCAEVMHFGANMITTGASSDIRQATSIARSMVVHYGMSDLGFVYLDGQDANLVDITDPVSREVKKIISNAMDVCENLLEKHRHDVEILAEALLERETLSGSDVLEICPPCEKE